MFRRSKRTQSAELSEIVRISEAVRARKAAGEDVLTFGTGEPDFPTPPHVIEAAHQAMLAGETSYPATQGTPALRSAIAKGAGVDPAQVIVSTGAKQVLANAALASLDPGDEVIVPAPYWTSYADIIAICQARVVAVPCTLDTGFKITANQLARAITPKTRWLLLNTPGNPSGAMYTDADLEALAEVLRDNPHVWVMADEIYEHIAYDPFTSFVKALPDFADRTLTINGVSKAYAMTGWRLGWGIGPTDLIKTMVSVQGLTTSGASSISQAAALAALTGPQELLAERCSVFRERRDFVVAALNATGRLDCPVPGGAFYVFPSCAGCLGLTTPAGKTLTTDADLCEYILDTAGVALVPGRAFGLPGHFRLSYAYSMEDLKTGLARITDAIDALS